MQRLEPLLGVLDDLTGTDMLSNEQLLNYEQAGFIPAVDVMSADEALVIRRSLEAFEATQGGQLDASQRSRALTLSLREGLYSWHAARRDRRTG